LAALYTEDGVALQLATELIYLGHTATTADAEGLKGAGDEMHLWTAAQRRWILVTHNGADFRLLSRAWQLWGVQPTHAGILVLAQTPRVLAPQAAQLVHTFLQTGPALANMLYEWHATVGWRPRP